MDPVPLLPSLVPLKCEVRAEPFFLPGYNDPRVYRLRKFTASAVSEGSWPFGCLALDTPFHELVPTASPPPFPVY